MKPFRFVVTAEVERQEGKFASRDEITENIQQWLEEANEQTIDTEDDAVYEIVSWEVSDE